MIIEYSRPKTLDETLALLRREFPPTVPLGGGTTLSRNSKEEIAVVDLQALGLNTIQPEGQFLRIGATTTLQELFEWPDIQSGLRKSIYLECNANIRRMATIAGALVTADGSSPLAAAMLALDSRIIYLPNEDSSQLGDWLPLRSQRAGNQLIGSVIIPLNADLKIETVARTPLDRPMVIVARAEWPSGRARIVVGGFGQAPRVAADGPEPSGSVDAVRNAFAEASDEWASAEYRIEAAGVLAQRLSTPEQDLP